MAEIYHYSLVVLVSLTLLAIYLLYGPNSKSSLGLWTSQADTLSNTAVANLCRRFLFVYVIVAAADWLQGSYFYTVYREGHGLPEATVGKLFATGFATGGIVATFLGGLADRYGRRNACLACCVASALSCLSVLVNDVRVLFAGRIFGGIATTLLYTVFEPWLLGELDRLCSDLPTRDDVMNRVFALMAVSNGLISVASGVFSEYLVRTTSSTKSPFIASVVFAVFAAQFIIRIWAENYGALHSNAQESFVGSAKNSGISWGLCPQVQRLCIITFAFESSVYVMIYFWPSAISSVRVVTGSTLTPPFGLIFANFMCAMALGSTAFRLWSSAKAFRAAEMRHVSQYILLIASISLGMTVASKSESVRFVAFCAFEVCAGIYSPLIASLKAQSVPDEYRSKVYGLFRVPTSVFIVIILILADNGEFYRKTSLLISSLLLVGGSLAISFRRGNKKTRQGASQDIYWPSKKAEDISSQA